MIEIVESAGYCYGVARAVKLAKEHAPCCTLGPLIHNRRAVTDLESCGVRVIDSLEGLYPRTSPSGASGSGIAPLLLRSHGTPPEVYAELERRGIPYIDATCPDVKKIHRLISEDSKKGRLILLFGDPEHPEVKASAAWCDECIVIASVTELEDCIASGKIDPKRAITAAAQTTAKSDDYEKCRKIIKKECTNAKILDTICGTTERRQFLTRELSRRVDVMVVVGDRSSANTRHLASVCLCPVFLVEGRENLTLPEGVRRIGVTAGASTPSAIIEEVILQMTELNKTELAAGELSFEEMIDSTLRPLNSGEKITGTIIRVSPTEVQVDLGSKHAAYIPLSELTDDPAANANDLCKVGEEIETYIMRVNDGEGTVTLSKRRLDTVKSWEDVEAAVDSRAVLEGVVVEDNKGGIVVSVKGVRVFVPASRTGVPRETPMSDLIKKKVRLRITEFNGGKRRVVGDIRSVTQEERGAASAAIWDNLEVGKKFSGTVRSLAPYGVFVDIGGVDGLVHLSELSWERVKEASDVVKVGDTLPVTVINLDKEKGRISLSCRKPEDDPWMKFVDSHNTGDVVKVKVNKLMPFGAFAEVMPGVDGLIHISQLTDRRIGKPSEAVNEGDTLEVKITEIDLVRKKISLSARALIEIIPDVDVEGETGPDEVVAVAEPPSEPESAPAEAEAPAEEKPAKKPRAKKAAPAEEPVTEE
jgi:4-hydroxy-3-methylbut-2-enyl diphosphate reductase